MLAPSKLIPSKPPAPNPQPHDDDDDEPDYLNHEPEERCKFSRRDRKPKLSLSDEREFMERDRAARWLAHQEQRRQARLRQARLTKAAQSRAAPSIARRRQESNTLLPWEGKNEFDEE